MFIYFYKFNTIEKKKKVLMSLIGLSVHGLVFVNIVKWLEIDICETIIKECFVLKMVYLRLLILLLVRLQRQAKRIPIHCTQPMGENF